MVKLQNSETDAAGHVDEVKASTCQRKWKNKVKQAGAEIVAGADALIKETSAQKKIKNAINATKFSIWLPNVEPSKFKK